MWAPTRWTAPSLAAAGGGEPAAAGTCSWPTCRPSATRAGPESLRSFAPVQSSWPPMWAPIRLTAPRAAAGGGEPAAEEHVLADLQAVGVQGGAGVVAQVRPVQSSWPPMWAPRRLTAPTLGVADDSCPVQAEHAAGEPGGIQRWLGGVFELASGQADGSQAGIAGEDAFLQEAIAQLKVDIRGEVFQVKPAGDPGPPKPQPMRIRIGREPPTQDVADHARPAGPGITPRPHRGLINRLIIGGQVEPFPAADVLDQRLLHRGQSPPGHLSDHKGTLRSVRDFARKEWSLRGSPADVRRHGVLRSAGGR